MGDWAGGPPEHPFVTPLAAFVFDGEEKVRPGWPGNEVPTVNALMQQVRRYDCSTSATATPATATSATGTPASNA